MDCPFCGKKSSVTNSRKRAGSTQVWRRRQCSACRKIWTTSEQIDMSTTHRVITSQKHYEPFSRDILFESIKDSLQHRKTALEDATALTDTVLSLLLRQFSSELEKPLIATVTHEVISRFDPVAAAVYQAKHS